MRMDRRENKNQKGADPEIEGVECLEVFAKIDDEGRSRSGDEAEDGDRLFAADVERLLQKRDAGLQHGEGTSDRREKEQKEKQESEDLAKGHLGEHEREDIEAEGKSSHSCDTGDSEKCESGWECDEAAKADLEKLVRTCRREAAQNDIIFAGEVARVGENHAEPHAKGKENLPGGGEFCGFNRLCADQLGLLRPSAVRVFFQKHFLGIPHEAEAVHDISLRRGGIGCAEGESEQQQEGHRPFAKLFDPFRHAAIDQKKIQQEDD
jgi:hypothetical protein